MRYLFYDKQFVSATVATYKAAIGRPILLAFNLDVSSQLFSDLLIGLQNSRPSAPYRPILWSLDKVLAYLESPEFNDNPSVSMLLLKTVFLVAIATGSRVSELNAIQRESKFLTMFENHVSITFESDFLHKNEKPGQRNPPILIKALINEDGSAHTLCPVRTLKQYLEATHLLSVGPLFVNKNNMPFSTRQISNLLCKLIKMSQKDVFPKEHDVRKMSTSLAFLAQFHVDEIVTRVGWSSGRVFRKHYLKPIEAIRRSCIVLGQGISVTNHP